MQVVLKVLDRKDALSFKRGVLKHFPGRSLVLASARKAFQKDPRNLLRARLLVVHPSLPSRIFRLCELSPIFGPENKLQTARNSELKTKQSSRVTE